MREKERNSEDNRRSAKNYCSKEPNSLNWVNDKLGQVFDMGWPESTFDQMPNRTLWKPDANWTCMWDKVTEQGYTSLLKRNSYEYTDDLILYTVSLTSAFFTCLDFTMGFPSSPCSTLRLSKLTSCNGTEKTPPICPIREQFPKAPVKTTFGYLNSFKGLETDLPKVVFLLPQYKPSMICNFSQTRALCKICKR